MELKLIILKKLGNRIGVIVATPHNILYAALSSDIILPISTSLIDANRTILADRIVETIPPSLAIGVNTAKKIAGKYGLVELKCDLNRVVCDGFF